MRQNPLETGRLINRLCHSLCEARVVVTERGGPGAKLVMGLLWSQGEGRWGESSGLCIRGAERRAEVKTEAEKVAQGSSLEVKQVVSSVLLGEGEG